MKTLIKIFSCLMLLAMSTTIVAFEAENVENYLDEVIRGHIDFKEHEGKLNATISIIEQQLERGGSDAFLWYLKGRSTFAALTIRSVIYGIDDSRYKELQKLLPIEYEKALALNKQSKVLTEKHLNYDIYGSLSVTVEAARQYLALKKQKTTLHKKEHLRVLRERIIPLLIKQNKFEEAYKEMNYIDEYFPENTQGDTGNIAWRQHFETEIEQQKNKMAEVEQEKTHQSTESKKPEPAMATTPQQQPIQQQPVVKAEDTPQKPKAKQEANNNQVIIIGIVLAVLLLIGFMLTRRKKK